MNDPKVELAIRQTYRFHYLKDAIMARYLDAKLSSTIESLIKHHHTETLHHIQQNADFLKNIFGMIKCRDTAEIDRTSAIQVVLQICTISKSLTVISRAKLYR
jgi:protein phosphatase-4 regulatory subunit 3